MEIQQIRGLYFEMNDGCGYQHKLLAGITKVTRHVWEASCNNKGYITGTKRGSDGSRLQVTFWVPTLSMQSVSWERYSSPKEDLFPNSNVAKGDVCKGKIS